MEDNQKAQQQQVPVEEIIQQLISVNSGLIKKFESFLEELEKDLTDASQGELQGEIEELLRLMIQTVQKTIEKLLALQEQLQTAIIESFFPAQD